MGTTEGFQIAKALEACDWENVPVGSKALILKAIEQLKRPASGDYPGWISVKDGLPEVGHDDFYGDEHSVPVLVRVIHKDGTVECPIWAFKYSFKFNGWVRADMADGYEPEWYVDYGTVTDWMYMPKVAEVQPPQAEKECQPA